MRFQFVHGTFDHGLFLTHGGPIQGETLLEHRGTVHHQVRFADKSPGVRLAGVLGYGDDFDADVVFGEDGLPRAVHLIEYEEL